MAFILQLDANKLEAFRDKTKFPTNFNMKDVFFDNINILVINVSYFHNGLMALLS